MNRRDVAALLALGAAATVMPALAAPAKRKPAQPRPDLADLLAGVWDGDVISDAQGSSRDNVSVTITKAGPNTIRVVSDYRRVPAVTIQVERAMQQIVATGGPNVVFYDPTRTPPQLDLNFEGTLSWSGHRRAG